jgi:hypothetical protein
MQQEPNRSYQRKASSLFIHKEMQREFSFMLIALLIVSSFCVALTIHYTIQHAAFGDQALQFGKVNPYEVISQVSYQIIMRVTTIFLLTLFAIAAYGIKFLHRVAGPIYRCRKNLIMLNQRKIPDRIRLRTGDFFQEVADEINRQTDLWINENRRKEELSRQVADLADSLTSPDTKAKVEALKQWI